MICLPEMISGWSGWKRDVEAKGREIDAKPTLKQYLNANIGKIALGVGVIALGIVVAFMLLAEN